MVFKCTVPSFSNIKLEKLNVFLLPGCLNISPTWAKSPGSARLHCPHLVDHKNPKQRQTAPLKGVFLLGFFLNWTQTPKIVPRRGKKLLPDFSRKQFLVPGSYYGGQGLFLDQSQFSGKLLETRTKYKTPADAIEWAPLLLHNSFDGAMLPICPDEGRLPPYGHSDVPFTMTPV